MNKKVFRPPLVSFFFCFSFCDLGSVSFYSKVFRSFSFVYRWYDHLYCFICVEVMLGCFKKCLLRIESASFELRVQNVLLYVGRNIPNYLLKQVVSNV